jgi:hypothetical protein
MKVNQIRTIGIVVAVLFIVYIGMMLHYKTARPNDIYQLSFNKSWCIDSVKVERGLGCPPVYPNCPDSGWTYGFSIYARNNISQALSIDSVLILDRSTGFLSKGWFQYTINNNPLNANMGNVVLGNKPFALPLNAREPWKRQNLDVFQQTMDNAFAKHDFEVIVYSSRGFIKYVPQRYIIGNRFFVFPQIV